MKRLLFISDMIDINSKPVGHSVRKPQRRLNLTERCLRKALENNDARVGDLAPDRRYPYVVYYGCSVDDIVKDYSCDVLCPM